MIINKLVPPALAVYEARIQGGDLEAARDILFGVGVLQKNAASATLKVISDGQPIKDIETYRRYRKRLASQGSDALVPDEILQ